VERFWKDRETFAYLSKLSGIAHRALAKAKGLAVKSAGARKSDQSLVTRDYDEGLRYVFRL